ncbi:MAG: hypothetical protein SLAVMIC_00591 [uncultured marine phage]|uniref:Uncharacterized protein n=1 Tax=uncultured marine phage TaxID=707152 RepID=A0A8D9C966_9VIRU|nr:MAG: hypothetical protein SLAVMIC_00591 [uncultured marine phage]
MFNLTSSELQPNKFYKYGSNTIQFIEDLGGREYRPAIEDINGEVIIDALWVAVLKIKIVGYSGVENTNRPIQIKISEQTTEISPTAKFFSEDVDMEKIKRYIKIEQDRISNIEGNLKFLNEIIWSK